MTSPTRLINRVCFPKQSPGSHQDPETDEPKLASMFHDPLALGENYNGLHVSDRIQVVGNISPVWTKSFEPEERKSQGMLSWINDSKNKMPSPPDSSTTPQWLFTDLLPGT